MKHFLMNKTQIIAGLSLMAIISFTACEKEEIEIAPSQQTEEYDYKIITLLPNQWQNTNETNYEALLATNISTLKAEASNIKVFMPGLKEDLSSDFWAALPYNGVDFKVEGGNLVLVCNHPVDKVQSFKIEILALNQEINPAPIPKEMVSRNVEKKEKRFVE